MEILLSHNFPLASPVFTFNSFNCKLKLKQYVESKQNQNGTKKLSINQSVYSNIHRAYIIHSYTCQYQRSLKVEKDYQVLSNVIIMTNETKSSLLC